MAKAESKNSDLTITISGKQGSGKTTIADAVAHFIVRDMHRSVLIMDGEDRRTVHARRLYSTEREPVTVHIKTQQQKA